MEERNAVVVRVGELGAVVMGGVGDGCGRSKVSYK